MRLLEHESSGGLVSRQQIARKGRVNEHTDFSRVQPGHTEPTNSEERVKDEQESRLGIPSLRIVIVDERPVRTRQHCHGGCHAESLVQKVSYGSRFCR